MNMRPLLCLASIFAVCLSGGVPVSAYTPESPEVQAMVGKGIKYLEGLDDAEVGKSSGHGGEEFHSVVIAYAHLKAKHDPSAAVVKRGVAKARELAADVRQEGRQVKRGNGSFDKSTYEVSISILLLCEAGAEEFKADIEVLRDGLFGMQQPTGGFGYPGEDKGDTSQTQYVVLAMWTMDQNGIAVNEGVVNRTHMWLMRVQDIGGAWPYRAEDPGGSGLMKQGTAAMSHSTALAGASSILIAGDFFRMWREKTNTEGLLPGMPKAIKVAEEAGIADQRKRAAKVGPQAILGAITRMNGYRSREPYKRNTRSWHYYAMYSVERFESFYEFAVGSNELEPEWYNSRVRELRGNQDVSGGWGIKDKTAASPPIATAFAILFLVRSTQKAIAQANSGTLAGGYGLPSDTTDIRVDGTQIKGRPVAAQVTEMLDLLEQDGAGETEGKSIPDDLELDTDPAARAAQLDRLERLVRGSKSWQARRVAARLLGKSDELRVVPALIFALSDPDTSVRRYARDGLRFISRKFDGFGMPDEPTLAELQRAQKEWRDWYRSVNPKYVFLDYDL